MKINKGRVAGRNPSAYGTGPGPWVGHPESAGACHHPAPTLRRGFGRFTTAMVAALALAGCAHKPRVAIVHCVTPEQVEQLRKAEPPKISNQLTGKADEDVRVIAGSALRLRSWGHGLLGVIEGCTK